MSASTTQDETPFKAPDFGQYRGRRLLLGTLVAGGLVWGGLALGRWTARPASVAVVEEELAPLVPLEKKVAAAVQKPAAVKRSKSARSAPVAAPAQPAHAVKVAVPRAAAAEAAQFDPDALAPWTAPTSPPPPPPAEPALAAPPAPAEPAVVPAPTETSPASAPPAEPLAPEPSPTEAALLDPALDGNGEAVARGIAAQKRSAIQQCFEQELKRTPALKGMVTVEMDLAPPHRVDDVRVVDDLGRPAFTQCVASTMQHVTFVALNEEVSVQMPFKLSSRAK